MIIAQNAVDTHLKKGCMPVYMVLGQEPYLFQQTVLSIKKAFRAATSSMPVSDQDDGKCEETVADINQSQDWVENIQQANTYSLFSEYQLLDLRFAKKTLDTTAKTTIQSYLDKPNLRALLLIQAPELPFKQLQAFHSHPHMGIIQVQTLAAPAFKKFIVQRLQSLQISYTEDIPEKIYQYHQTNLLACSQFLDLLASMHDLTQLLDSTALMPYLRDQSEFSIYELGEACLNGQASHAIHMARQIQQAQAEPILVLWVLSQELRKIAEVHHLLSTLPIQAACQQLKIWTQKIPFYQRAVQRIAQPQAYELLQYCQHLDEQLKSNRNAMIWQELEHIILQFCA